MNNGQVITSKCHRVNKGHMVVIDGQPRIVTRVDTCNFSVRRLNWFEQVWYTAKGIAHNIFWRLS